MPGRDRTGPMGEGPMTGRGAGDCAGYDAFGYGARGRGRGRRRWYRATRFAPQVTKAEETQALRAQAQWLGEHQRHGQWNFGFWIAEWGWERKVVRCSSFVVRVEQRRGAV